ncbi:hypothetical protein [Nostoc parmelioides]|uniref:Uncharacterized protein n=1 Tax=Nostoc parmelioides FACHB-3921 TaxID=2692909 RepID=A0ABR8BDE0_9NOSO|nr:hypothetical protein [Nostoc parmelioides]MBD2251790.1 hypothetical protein [Nostoc parmelioides FACHB-3921]
MEKVFREESLKINLFTQYAAQKLQPLTALFQDIQQVQQDQQQKITRNNQSRSSDSR